MTAQVQLLDPTSLIPSTVASRVEEVVGGGFDVGKFVRNFDVLANVAGSTKHLKELVLQLAVRGGLSGASAETADPLITELERARVKLAKGGIRVGIESPPVSDGEAPHPLPRGWRWVRLRDFGGFLGGGTPAKSNDAFWRGPLPWVSPKDMKRPHIDDAEDHISVAAVEGSAVKLIPAQSLLYVVRGMILAHSFPVAVATREVAINQDMKALVLAMPELSEFVLRSLQAARRRVLARVERSSHGTCRLESEVVEMLPVALPPLAEQKRIVARVDQLMALCDDLDAHQAKKREVRTRLTKSALEALSVADSPEEFSARWSFVESRFPLITESSKDVEVLRSAIRGAACAGRLSATSGRAGWGTGDADIEAIMVERKRKRSAWLKDGVRPSSLPREERADFSRATVPSLPPSWALCGIDDLLACVPNALKAGPFGSALTKRMYSSQGFKVYGQEQVIPGDHRIGSYYVDASKFESLKTCAVNPGDMLVSLMGTVGRVLILPTDAEPGIINPRLLKLTLSQAVCAEYIKLYLESPQARVFMDGSARGIAMDGLNIAILRALPISLPPLAEQKWLIAKVGALMALCDDLEAKLRRAEDRAAKLVLAAIHELVA